jgi:hypothetical protein
MKMLAPLLLGVLAAVLFILLMGSSDAAQLGRGAFFSLATPFVLLYGLCSICLKKYRKTSSAASYAALFILVLAPSLRVLALFNEALLMMSSKTGGRYLFILAVADIIVGYYAPWPKRK